MTASPPIEAERSRPASTTAASRIRLGLPDPVALFDDEGVRAAGQLRREQAGESRDRRAGGGIFRNTQAGCEHAGVKAMAGVDRLATDDIGRAARTERPIEAGGIGMAALDRGARCDVHECERDPRRPARRRGIPNLVRRKTERRRDDRMVRYRAELGRQLRDGETGTASCIPVRLERAVYWADRLLQHDLAARAAAVAQAEQNRCSHGGMTGEGQFPTRG